MRVSESETETGTRSCAPAIWHATAPKLVDVHRHTVTAVLSLAASEVNLIPNSEAAAAVSRLREWNARATALAFPTANFGG
jgi:hypothetical protein